MRLPVGIQRPLMMTKRVAQNSDCRRRRVGCVIIRWDGLVVSCGYNHNPYPGKKCESCPREKYASGDRLDLCHAVHAEADAIAHAAALGVKVTGCTAFVSVFPCPSCTGLLIESGISRVIVIDGYAGAKGSEELFRDAGYTIKPQADYTAYSFDIIKE